MPHHEFRKCALILSCFAAISAAQIVQAESLASKEPAASSQVTPVITEVTSSQPTATTTAPVTDTTAEPTATTDTSAHTTSQPTTEAGATNHTTTSPAATANYAVETQPTTTGDIPALLSESTDEQLTSVTDAQPVQGAPVVKESSAPASKLAENAEASQPEQVTNTTRTTPATETKTNPETTPPATTATPSATTSTTTANTPATTSQAKAATVSTTATEPNTAPQAANSQVVPIEGQTVDVRIISTTDLHTNLINYDYYQDKTSETLGLAKAAVLIKEAKQENSNVILVDNGDLIQGTPLGTYKALIDPIEDLENHPMYAALEKLGFDASTLGNHEFNYGLDYLKRALAATKLPVLNANVRDAVTKDFVFNPYTIVEKTFTDQNGLATSLKVGITGIVPPQIMNWDKSNLEGKVVVDDAVEAIQNIVPTLRQAGADIILVLSHSGIGDDEYQVGEENVGYQIASIEGVDAVVTGHSHAEFPSGDGTGFYEKYRGVDGINGTINGTPVTMGGKYGDHIGIIDLNLTYTNGQWQVNSGKGSIRKIDTKSSISDEDIIALAKEAHEGTIAYVRQQVGTTTAPINSYFALVQDDPSVQIVNNAQIWYAKQELAGTPEADLPLLSAAAPFKAGTRNDPTSYTDIPAGPIAIKNVADLYLYDNVTAIIKVTGSQLKEWLEMSAGQFNQIDPNSDQPQALVNTDFRTYNFDVIDGVTYQFDITQPNKYDRSGNLVNPDANRVLNLSYQGQPVTDDQEFIVVSNNYRANGNFPGVRDASIKRLLNLENRQAIIDYIVKEKTINPSADNNWTFASTIKNLDLRFLTAESAKVLVADSQQILYIAPSDVSEGFGEYRFIFVEPTSETIDETTETGKEVIDTEITTPGTVETPTSTTDTEPVHIQLGNQQTVTLPGVVRQPNSQTLFGQTSSSRTQTRTTTQATPLSFQKASTAKAATTSNNRQLPKTGSVDSQLSLAGLLLLPLFTLLKFKNKENQ